MKTKLTFLKKVLVFVMVMMLMGTFSFAQTIITIGTGTTTNSSTSYPAPYGNYWWGAKQQFLIRAADITAAGGAMGTISSLAFNVATVQGTALTGFTIKMGTTSQTAATTTFFTGLTTVLTTTSYTEVSGWNTHTFTTPFSWDGSSNLVIETCFNNTGYTSNAQVRNSTTTYASSIDRHADAAGVCAQTTGALTYSVRPNMRLGITMGTPPQKDLGILSWDSPNSSCGMSSAESVTIKVKNYGLASQNSYSLKYSTNGGTSWVTQAMTTAILPGDTLTHTFTTPANFATVGTYSCIAEVVLALDSNSLNNTLSKTIVATAGMATPYFNNLESMPTGYMTTGDWISSTTSNPAWQIDVSNTSSSNTGPNIDHTLGTSAGKYAYLETSGGSTGSTSYLTGPCANFSNQPAILNFWYHMYGAAMGTLEVQQKVGGTWIATGWSKTGQQHSSMGAAWTEATVSINPAADGIRFKGVRGTSYTSDMCIDDINLYVPMPNDLAMIEWTSPVAGTPPSATMPITVKVFNAGLQAQDTIPLKYSINGGTSWVSAISYPTLLPGDTLTYTFATTANMATPGYYSCIGVVSNPGDGAAVNDTIFNTPYLCSSLSGTYSLGSATTADFPSFSAAVFALNSCGVSGPVTINVDTGTYTEQVTIGSINGASATNTITFKSLSGINTDVILQYAATSSTANWTVRFNGSNYVNFKQITVKAIGASYGRVFELIGAANYNGIDSCKIMMPSTTSGNFAGIYSYTTKDEYNTFTNNQIIGGYYGLYFYGGTGTTNLGKGNSFVGNEITDYYYYGTYFYYHDSIQFNNNIVENRVGSGSVYGARFYYCDNIHVVGNKINVHGTSTHYGMYIYYADATSANPSIIANNFIALTGTGTSTWYGMYLYNSTYVNVYYNSYNLIAGSTSSRGLYMSSGTNQNYKNNIFKNSGGGYAAYFNTPTAILSSDYNDFYVSGTNLAYWSGNRTSLTALQTASSKDANSVNINPPFTSSSDLHLMGTTLSALGTPITSVTVDIDGTPRSATAPTIGAHEVPLLPWDAGVSNVTAPIANAIVNEASLVPLTVVVKNYGTNNITTMTIQYSVNNGTPVNYLYTGTILPNATETVNLTSFTATAGNSNVCVKTVLVGDSNYFNDEYCQPFFGTPLKDATILEIVEIDDDCNIGLDTIQIMVQNVGIDTINGSVPTLITAHYQLNGITTIVNDTITQQINPGDTILFSFNVLADFTVTTSDSVFNIVAWVDLMNDNVPSNDTATADVESFGVPNPPTVSNTYIPYASYATLTAISTDTILWYQYDTSTVALAGGATFVTPVLTDTTTYWVQAGIKISGTGANVAPMAVASASTCNTGPCTSFNDLNFGSCGSQQVWLTSSASNPGSSVYIQFIWPSTKTVNKMTIHAGQNNTRFLTGGTIQIWTGSAWINHHTFTQAIGVCSYDIIFPNAATTRLRIIDMTVGGSQTSNVNFREIEIFEAVGGCPSVRVPVVVNVGPPPPIDAGVYDIISPSVSAPGGTPTPITVRVKNYGTNTLTSAVINWSLNGVTKPSFAWTGGSLLFDSISQPITIYTDTFTGGLYSMKAWTTLPNAVADSSHFNDTAYTAFSLCLNGTFTIGGSTSDYPTFTDALTTMDLVGICGPVVFNVASGTYTEQLNVTAINGGSATNTVTFKSATGVNTDVILQYASTSSSNHHTVRLNGADYISFKDMTILANGNYGMAVELANGANYNTFEGNILQTTASNTSSTNRVVYIYTGLNHFNTFLNNTTIGGYYNIYCRGASTTSWNKGNVFQGNDISGFHYYPTYFYYQDSVQIIGNYIHGGTGPYSYGVYAYYCNNAYRIVGNRIDATSTGTSTTYGMRDYRGNYYSYNPTPSGYGLIANNMISITGGTGNHYGIYSYYCKGSEYYYNSVNIVNGGTSSRCLYQYNTTGNTIGQTYKNNIFANYAGGYTAYFNTPTMVAASDYNDFYTSGTNLAYWSGNRTSLAALKTASSKDANSISTDPAFFSSTDLHLSLTSPNNLGTPITSVTTDYDGQTRSATIPDMGADEFDPLAHDLIITEFIAPISSLCGNVADPIRVVLRNMGLNAETNVPIIASVITPTGTVSTNVVMPSLPSGYHDTIIVGTVNTTAPGNYSYAVYPNLATDLDHTNDTAFANTTTALKFAVPHMEDFTTSPFDWEGTSAMNIGTDHGLTSSALYVNMYSSVSYQTANMTKKIGPIPANASLSFDYRITNWSGGAATTLTNDTIDVWVSSDCGTNWSRLYTIDSYSHVPAVTMQKVVIPLTPLTGNDVLIALEYIWASGDYWVDIDNVGIGLPPVVNLGVDTTFCAGTIYTIDGGTYSPSVVTYEWFAVGNSTAIGTSQMLNTDSAGTYVVEVKNEFGLIGTDTIILTQYAPVAVSFTGLSSPYCVDASGSTLTGTPSGGIFAGNGITGSSFDPSVAGAGTHSITYTYTDANTCPNVASQSVVVNPLPTITMTPDVTICQYDTTILNASLMAYASDLIFSEYIEGSSNNKAIELYNGTMDTVYLDNYRIGQAVNGGGWQYYHTFPVGATMAPGATWVMITNQTDTTMFAHANANEVLAYPSVVHHNGDDARSIEKTTNAGATWTIIDIIGDPDNDPGSGWPVAGVATATQNHTLIRKPNVLSPDTSWTAVAGIDSASSQYFVMPQNYFTNLGMHTMTAAATYLWSNSATTPAITVAPNTTTTYTVTVTGGNSCSTVDTIVITVNPTPAMNLGADANVCGSDSIILDAGAGAGYVYLWSDSTTAQTITVDSTGFGLSAQTFWVMVTDTNSACYSTDTIELTFVPGISVNLGTDQTIYIHKAPSSVTLDAGAGFATYLWDDMSILQTRQIIGSVVGAGVHTYYVDVTDANACTAHDEIIITVTDDSGINDLNKDDAVSIFPNPTKGMFKISFNGIKGDINMQIVDAAGRVINSEKLIGVNDGYVKEIDATNLADGVYYVKLMNNDMVKLVKLVIQ